MPRSTPDFNVEVSPRIAFEKPGGAMLTVVVQTADGSTTYEIPIHHARILRDALSTGIDKVDQSPAMVKH